MISAINEIFIVLHDLYYLEELDQNDFEWFPLSKVTQPMPMPKPEPMPAPQNKPTAARPPIRQVVATPVISAEEAEKLWNLNFRKGQLAAYAIAQSRSQLARILEERNAQSGRVRIQYLTFGGEPIGEPVNVPAEYAKRGKWHFLKP